MNDDTPAGVLRQSTEDTGQKFGIDRLLNNNIVKIFGITAIFIFTFTAVWLILAMPVNASPSQATVHVKVAFTNDTIINNMFTVDVIDSAGNIYASGKAPYNTILPNGDYCLRTHESILIDGKLLSGVAMLTIDASSNSEHIVLVFVKESPTAAFVANPPRGPAPLQVQFLDESTGYITDYLWNFGDGSTSTERNPSHLFSYADDYTVTLTVSGPLGTDTASKIIGVSGPLPPKPEADFTANPTSGFAPLTVQFTDISSNTPTSWSWNFGDEATSTEKNPSHIYTVPNVYTVSLTASNAGGSDMETRTECVTIYPAPAISADITAINTVKLTSEWDTSKVVAPDTWNLVPGGWGISQYTVSLIKTIPDMVYYEISGTVTVTNAGGVPTEDLTVIADITYREGSGDFVEIPGASLELPTNELAPGQTGTYNFKINVPAAYVQDGFDYRAEALVTIMTDSGSPGTPYSMNPKYTIGNMLTAPTNDEITVDDSNGQYWSFSASSSVTYPKTFLAEDGAGTYENTVTIRGTGESANAAVTVNVITEPPVDPQYTVEFDPATYTVSEGAGSVTLWVKLNTAATGDVWVSYETNDGTAIAPGKYTATSGQLLFHAGDTEKAITVPIIDDDDYSGDAYFYVKLMGASSDVVVGSPDTAMVTITDDESVPVVYFKQAAYIVNEDGFNVVLDVSLSAPVSNDVVVHYQTVDGTALSGVNYTGIGVTDGTITFTAGDTADKQILVLIRDDEIYGGDTQFSVVLTSVSSGKAILGSPDVATVTITDDEHIFTVTLHKGWNLISCPLVIQPFYASELGAKGIIEVATYQKATNSYKIFLMGWDDPLSEQDFQFQTDIGYFVAVDQDMPLTFVGKLPVGRTLPLAGDNKWDLYGWSTLNSQRVYQFADGLSGTQTIAKYNYLTNTYTIFLEGWNTEADAENFLMVPGEGYFVSSNTATTINYGGIKDESV